MADLDLKPVTFKCACEFIGRHHRHHNPPSGYKFGIGAYSNGILVGVATVGRPVSRVSDDGFTAEVTRLCTDGTYNACSLLYSACARAAKAMGYCKIQTYILESETGTSLRASGWTFEAKTRGKTWSRPSRIRKDDHPLDAKQRWSRDLGVAPTWSWAV